MINNVWMYLKVITMADIVTFDGKWIEEEYIKRSKTIKQNGVNKIEWPKQPNPGKQSWEYWRQALRQLTDYTFQMKQPLRNWIYRWQSNDNTFYSPSTEYIYEKNEKLYNVYKYENGSYH